MTEAGQAAGGVSEDLVFDRLQRSRREGDVVWRNQRLTDDVRNAELDFLLGLPGSGFVAVEVKGGSVTVEGDAWIQQSRGGYRKRVNPITQAREGMYGLRDYVEADPRWTGRGRVRWGHAVVLPFSDVAPDFARPECPRHMVFGRHDLDDLVPRLAAITDRQQRDRPATAEDVVLVREILRGRGHVGSSLCAVRQSNVPVGAQLTDQQRAIVELTRNMSRIEVRGRAGSGKTTLGLEQARRLAGEGRRVALVCCSAGAASLLARETGRWPRRLRPSYVGTVAGLPAAGLPAAGLPAGGASRAAGARSRLPRFDAIVLDQAEDLGESEWSVVLDSLREPATGHLTLLNDEHQRSLGRPAALPARQVVLVLDQDLRAAAPPAESAAAVDLVGRPPTRGHVDTTVVPCAAGAAVATGDGEVGALLESGRRPGDVAVLTTSGRHPKRRSRRIGDDSAYWEGFWVENEVFYGNVREFKGLERPVVVLLVDESAPNESAPASGGAGPAAESPGGSSDVFAQSVYLGRSRARERLVVCGDVASLEAAGFDASASGARPTGSEARRRQGGSLR